MNPSMFLLASQLENVVRLIAALIIFVFVLVITYGTTRWIGKFQKTYQTGKNIEYVEGFRLSGSKYIQIVRIGKKYVALAVCKDTVTFLADVPEEDIVLGEDENRSQPSFCDIFARLKTDKADSKDESNHDEEKNI